MGPKYIRVTTLTFQGYVTSLITWPYDSAYAVSYWCPIGTEPLLSTILDIFVSKYRLPGSQPWPFRVTTLTLQGHVTSQVTWPIDSPYAISYWCLFDHFRDIRLPKPVRTHRKTDTHSETQYATSGFYNLSNTMYCIGQTVTFFSECGYLFPCRHTCSRMLWLLQENGDVWCP